MRHTTLYFGLAFCGIAVLLMTCQPVEKQHPETSSRLVTLPNTIDSLVRSYYSLQQFSGAVLVAEKGEVLINQEYGYAKLDSSEAISTISMFEIASLSKQFTAMLIMMLKEEGKLDYDDPVVKFLPSLPYQNISIRHLLTHTSGLSERQFFAWAGQNMDPTRIYHNEIILQYLEQEEPALAFEPGESWEYSNVGYFVLALILQEVTDRHYVHLLEERILTPLGMGNTGILSQSFKGEMDTYVRGKAYNPRDSAFVSSFGMAWSDSIYGGVGILSNSTDLLKWDRALYGNSLLDQELLQEAFDPYKLANDSSSGYGFGWFVKENYIINTVNSGKRLDHYGLWPGYESSIVRYVDADKTIVILSNMSPSAKDKMVEEISALLFRDPSK